MPSKVTVSRKRIRLLACIVAAGLAAAGYWYRDLSGPPSSPRIDPATLPADLDESFEVLTGCRIVANPGNDGDSFRVRHRGDEHTFRLYFVDCPETSDRYPDRIGYQGEYLGGLTPAQTIAIGKEASEFTLKLLEERPYAILTRWEKVMKSYRYHAFVLVENGSEKPEHLSEILVRHGLARIYTMGADLPDKTPRKQFENHLKSVEREARAARVGAWRY